MEKFKITVYSVRKVERPLFEKLNKYDFDLNLISDRLTIDNVNEAEGSDAILISGFDNCDRDVITKLYNYGIKYVYTRVTGTDNIDFEAIDGYGIQVAYAPGYSPRSVAELAFTLGMTLFRHVSQATYNTHSANFSLLPIYFSNEIHNATVGIIGAGHIGTAEAKLYKSIGAKTLAYQRHPDPKNEAVEFTDMDTLLKESDIVSIHVPYIPGKTGNIISEAEIDKMKDTAILINTARGPVVNNQAVSYAVRNYKIGGYGTDVLLDESQIMGKQFDSLDDLPNDIDKDLMLNYPNVIVTPHMGFYTEKAVEDMINISFDNFESMLKTGKPVHMVNK